MSSYQRKPLNPQGWMCLLSTVRMLWLSHQIPVTTFLKFVSFCLDFDCYPGDDLVPGGGGEH